MTERWRVGRLLPATAAPAAGEHFAQLLSRQGTVIEQILSSDTPGAQEYDQAHDEWVVLLDGEAEVDVEGTTVTLVPGDHLFLPAHTHHRVLTTRAGTRWLAVHLHGHP